MRALYSSPLRVYLLLSIVAIAGIFSGANLPISLFPNSSKPTVYVDISFGSMSAVEFLESSGRNIETALRGINGKNLEIEKLSALYYAGNVEYQIDFKWKSENDEAIAKVREVLSRFTAQMPQEVRQSIEVYPKRDGGFFAASYYSSERDLTSLYELIESTVGPELGSVTEAGETEVWNPAIKELQIELHPEAMASLQLLPNDIARAVLPMLESYSGGAIQIGDKRLSVQIPKRALSIADFSAIPVITPRGRVVQLKDVAKIDLTTPLSATRVVKTSGAPSVIVFAAPKLGGNIKKMSEDIIKILEDKSKTLPPDIHYKLLVDPSEFIRSAINNVLREVFMAAGIAVIVLFLFIGSLKNVATAAIEIPLSIIMAFIFMRLSGMNLNIISLGGLALSAGMNVDASVVVMENIFRHFETAKNTALMTFEDKLNLVVKAVDEVKLPVIASTIASLVVFLPLIFTGGLGAAILGDLAKAVLFSHGLSAVVALILVPTIRLQMLKTETQFHLHSPIEGLLYWIEGFYVKSLKVFLQKTRLRLITNLGLLGVLALCIFVVAPRIPQEIIGRPDSDWMILVINSQGNSMIKQMESQAEEIEAKALQLLGNKVMYTFTQVNQPGRATVMLRLKDKHEMDGVWKTLEGAFANTPQMKFFIVPWNPSERPLPNPPHLKVSFRGGTAEAQAMAAQEFNQLVESKEVFPRVWSEPDSEKVDTIYFEPAVDLQQRVSLGGRMSATEVADFSRVASKGKVIGLFPFKTQQVNILLKFPDQYLNSVEDLEALPVGSNDKVLPLKSFAKANVVKTLPVISRENERSVYLVLAKQNQGKEALIPQAQLQAKGIFDEWNKTQKSDVTVKFEEPNPDLKESLSDLGMALGISIALILITMILQMGSFINSLLVILAVPLGLIGAILSLFVFQSSVSLNSLLGIILLSGIAVANSIILVDFLRRLVADGMRPEDAALEAARTRLRPILMTTLTTSLGMLPIAFGHGEGGKILQPLGIVVSSGIFISMLLTLFIVPGLQVQYLNRKQRS